MVKINNPTKQTVFAMCDRNGSFEELMLLKNSQIIEDRELSEEDEEDGIGEWGLNYIKYKNRYGEEDEGPYLEKIEI